MMRIVVVEDEVKIRQGIVNLIHKHTTHTVVAEASNGRIGLNASMEFHPDLIITDIKMPELSGIDMLGQLKKEGISCYTIILTGFSEFEYAQKAIKFGVCEYMLKPITADELISVLDNIEKKIKEEEYQQYQYVSAEKDILYKMITANSDDKDMINHVNTMLDTNQDSEFTVVMVNIKRISQQQQQFIKECIAECFGDIKGMKYYIVQIEEHFELLILIKRLNSNLNIERMIKTQIIDEIKRADIRHSIWAIAHFVGLEKVKETVKELRGLWKWTLLLGEDALLSAKQISTIHTIIPQYAIKLENKMKKALYNMEAAEIKHCAQEFVLSLKGGAYHPAQITDMYVRYVSAILSLVKETNNKLYQEIEKNKYQEKFIDARSLEEFNDLLEAFITSIIDDNKKSDITNYIIAKTINYIKEHYNEMISLDEVAQMLGITSVYLSSQFNKEVGINFTQFIKELRMNKAKQLMMTTDMKLYEVGEKVGYQDPKYFCRVFKEVCGISPKIYREMNNTRL